MNRIYYPFVTLAILIILPVSAQDNVVPLKYSFRDGTYFYFADQAISRATPFEGIVAVKLSRDNGRGYKEVALIARPESATAFRKISGEQVWSQIKQIKRLQTDEQVWQFILQHPRITDYGVLSFSISFRQAMGSAYVDRDAAGLSPDKRWNYRIEFIDASGKIINSSVGSIQGGEQRFALANVKLKNLFATDSSVFITWSAPFQGVAEGLILADVYRQSGAKGTFTRLEKSILANVKDDSVYFYLDDAVVPQQLYRYYIRPKDQLGNLGTSSDTASALAVNFARLPLLQQLTVTDTLNALVLKWKALGDVPQVIGVEIQRSRDARGNYVIIDTVSARQSSYLDSRVFPGVPYFYRLRILGLKGMERETGFSGYATASVRNQHKNPDPPYALKASIENGFIKLQWQGASDPDLYAYFVYRGNSEQGKFEVISSGITDTKYVDSSRIGGRTQYVYAVKAVSNNSLESEFSNKVSLRQAVAQLPVPPGGINAHMDNRKVSLSWPSMARVDHNIAGYNIYRRVAQKSAEKFDQQQSAASQAGNLKFELLNSTIVATPAFEDATAATGINYEYAISSVDVFGIESTFSPFTPVSTVLPVRIIQHCSIRKVTEGVMLEWDPTLQRDTDSIVIKRKKAGDATYQRIGTLKNESSFLDKTAVKGVLYIYQVQGEKSGKVITRTDEQNIKI
jgi:fibronectin type 3 domain-containing protein